MKNLLLLLLLPFSILANDRVPISCAPIKRTPTLFQVPAEKIYTVKDGNWFDGSIWSTGKVPDPNANVDRVIRHFVTSPNRVVKIYAGTISNDSAYKGGIKFTGINENNMVGSNMTDVRDSDVGLGILGSASTNIHAKWRNPHPYALIDLPKGSTAVIVEDATGWKIGDEIVINPTTQSPKVYPLDQEADDFNTDNAGNPLDPYAAQFERRKIIAVNGNQIIFDKPLLYDHSSVSFHRYKFFAVIANLTRDFVIEGTATGYAHVFVNSSSPQVFRNVELRFMGPSKNRTAVTGVYPYHMHFAGYGVAGSIIDGISVHDGKSRGIVIHESHKVTVTNNNVFNIRLAALFWDFQDQTHLVNWSYNYLGLQTNDGANSSEGFVILGQGDGNRFDNNIIIRGDKAKGGGMEWLADNEADWLSVSYNVVSNTRIGSLTWQNSPFTGHTGMYNIFFNCPRFAIAHGAYLNSYRYAYNTFHNTNVQIQASSSYSLGMSLDNSYFSKTKLIVHGSAVESSEYNLFKRDTFDNQSVIEMYTEADPASMHLRRKKAAFINCVNPRFTFHPKSGWDSEFYVQDATGAKIIKQSGTTTTKKIFPDFMGTGDGLMGKYYNGANKNKFAFEQLDVTPNLTQVSVNFQTSPDGLDHRITDKNQYSVEWTGFIQPTYSGQQQFQLMGAQGFRLYVDGKLLIDDWKEHGEATYTVNSSQISLEQGKKYSVKIETFNTTHPYEIHFKWWNPLDARYVYVPQSQLYSTGTITQPPVPPANKPPTVTLGNDIVLNWPDSTTKIDGTANDPDGTVDKYIFTKVSGGAATIEQNLSDAADARITGLSSGVYIFRLTVTDNKGATASDEIQITVNSKPIDTTAPVDPCKTFIEADYLELNPDIAAAVKSGRFKSGLEHYTDWGKTEKRKINKACGGPVVFKNTAMTQSVNCLDGTVRSHTVPAGKYTAASQSAADALALQEINTELAKCPKPLFELKDGTKIIYIFKEGETYKLIVK